LLFSPFCRKAFFFAWSRGDDEDGEKERFLMISLFPTKKKLKKVKEK
jgi:hypothetical protein